MVSSLTELVKTYPDNACCIDNWVEGVFPLILDVEQKAAEKVQEVSLRPLHLLFVAQMQMEWLICFHLFGQF